MAEEVQFGSRTDSKRKYDESPPPSSVPRRSTGFSAPIASPDSQNPNPNSYTNAPPPLSEIELAKQKAQEIAARLFSSAEAKRPRVDNGTEEGPGKGFNSAPPDIAHKHQGMQIPQVGVPPAAQLFPYGFQGASKKIDIPNGRVGVIIGKGGETIRYLQLQSGAKIQVTRDMDADPTSQTRLVELVGTSEQISKAEQLINDVLSEAESGGSGGSGILATRKLTSHVGAEQFTMTVPNNKVGLIIGKGGETIKNMQARSGARIQLIPLHLPMGDTSMERTLQMDGSKDQIEIAKQLVNEIISSESRPRNLSFGGGYSQQGYRPPRPSTNWATPGPPPMQQPGYGYVQPGAFPGPPPTYNTSQPPYGSYPQQQTSGGYSSGWDQTPVPPTQQIPQGGSGYDYYGQQQQQQQQPTSQGGSSTATDGTNYGYNQPPAANYTQQPSYGDSGYTQPPSNQQQAYSQEGYNGAAYPTTATPQPGYTQQQSNPQPGYEQSQGYNSAPAYINAIQDGGATGVASYGAQTPSQTPTQQGLPPAPAAAVTQQGYSAPPTATTPPNYASQGYSGPPTSQPGSSQPPAQSAYGQSPMAPSYGSQGQKVPTAQPVYGQTPPPTQGSYVQPAPPVQQGYSQSQPPLTQPGYVQTDPGHLRAPPVGYGPSQSGGYTQQSYGAPMTAQPGYGQQQPPYNDSYSGYQQPPAYSTDTVPSTYNAPSGGGQPPVQTGVPKASPPS